MIKLSSEMGEKIENKSMPVLKLKLRKKNNYLVLLKTDTIFT